MFEIKNIKKDLLTVPNFITLFRILLIPVFIILLLQKQNIYALLIFIIACVSDGLDGFIARTFNQESEIGALIDPIADRLLLICGSITLCFLGRLPLWIVVLILIRDFSFFIGGFYLIKKCNWRPKVIFLGKVATALFYIGFAMLVIGWPWTFGLNIIDVLWLPGFSSDIYFVGIWPVYIAILLNIFTSSYYIKEAISKYKEVQNGKH